VLTSFRTAACLAMFVLCAFSAPAADAVTFNRDVASIVYQHCTKCHHPGDIAPMSLVTYKEARPWARAMRQAVLTRKMPPWPADPQFGHFSNDQRLSAQDIETIQKWVDGGSKEGDAADLKPAPVYQDGWKIGKPDAIIPIPSDFVVKPNDPDQYVYLRAPTNFTEDRWISAVELRPGNRRIVHHAHVYVYVPKDSGSTPAAGDKPKPFIKHDGLNHINPALPVRDDGCASPDGGNVPGGHPDENNILGSYLPGKDADIFPDGYARKVPKGGVLEFQIHYNAAGISQGETDRTSVGLIFSKEAPKQALRRIDIPNYLFQIPAGDPDHRVTSCYTFPRDVELMSYTAHMHLRGKDMKFEAVHPDGRRETLAFVPNYDFNWQTEYKLAEPVAIERGTKIIITAHFDNSPNNHYNPDPSKVIRWGEPSYEEMMDGWIEFILPKPESGASLASR